MDPATRMFLEAGGLCDITTTGARSGKPHRIEITLHHFDGRYFIGGKPGRRRDWLANLKADPEFTLHLRNGDDVIAHATEITDPAERDRILTAIRIRWGGRSRRRGGDESHLGGDESAGSFRPPVAREAAVWEPFQFFIGSWRGTGEGHSGASLVERTYRWVLHEKFLEVSSRSTYPPQERNPVGEVHDEMGIVSFDTTRGLFVFRQFHGEGFVNQYVATALSPLTFETEALENVPDGWRARETYLFDGGDSFIERFELAAPGKAYDLYSENHLTRVE